MRRCACGGILEGRRGLPSKAAPANFGRYRQRVSFLASNERVKYTS
jgi:hypothetical protein